MRFLSVSILVLTTLVIIPATLSGCALIELDESGADNLPHWARRDPASQALSDERIQAAREARRLHQERVRKSMEERQITVGMDMSQVRSLWGEPGDIETAGDPRYGNQKWVYFEGLSSRWSMSNERVVFFENGQVVGWQRP